MGFTGGRKPKTEKQREFEGIVGSILRDRRKSLKINLPKTSEALGMSKLQIINWELGRQAINLMALVEYCSFLSMDAGYVINEARRRYEERMETVCPIIDYTIENLYYFLSPSIPDGYTEKEANAYNKGAFDMLKVLYDMNCLDWRAIKLYE